MKINYQSIFALGVSLTFLASCTKDSGDPAPAATEFNFIRLFVNDETSTALSLVTPSSGKVETFQAKFPKVSLYTTESGRYASIVYTANNLLETFDTGLELHGDHVDVKGTPKFGALTGESQKPTHFKSQGGELITFNDGDGTLSVGSESDIHTAGKKLKQIIPVGSVAHHGAMARFSNGTYAVTIKDGSVSGSLPERVKVIGNAGADVHASSLATKGIHGNASNGTVAVFGSASGVLVVESSGNQRLITYPESFGTAWLSTIYYAKGANKFIGYSAAKGAYEIDLTNNTLKPIIESTDILQCKVDYAGKQLAVLQFNGTLKLYDLAAGTLKKEGNAVSAVAKDETQKPVLVATSGYVYVTSPKTGEVLQISQSNFSSIKKFKVSSTPYQLTVVGYESSEGH